MHFVRVVFYLLKFNPGKFLALALRTSTRETRIRTEIIRFFKPSAVQPAGLTDRQATWAADSLCVLN